MRETIYRDDAIKAMRECFQLLARPRVTAIKAINAIPSADRPQGEWIPCSERLPNERGNYLISGKWGSGKEAVGDCEFSVDDGYFRTAWNFDVLAWMPLPKPWKGADDEASD